MDLSLDQREDSASMRTAGQTHVKAEWVYNLRELEVVTGSPGLIKLLNWLSLGYVEDCLSK